MTLFWSVPDLLCSSYCPSFSAWSEKPEVCMLVYVYAYCACVDTEVLFVHSCVFVSARKCEIVCMCGCEVWSIVKCVWFVY